MMKTLFDRVFSVFGLLISFPVILVIAASIKISDKGPVLFRQKRVGQYGKLFTIFKFRTMISNDEKNSISVKGDDRITKVGKVLRKYKLDELPELWNILIGDMSFVGPRPDVPGYADKLSGNARKILELKPGITGPATLIYSNEEELLAKVDDPQKYNDEVLFPDKVRINLEYFEKHTISMDFKIIFKTIFRKNY
jgi:lipopolysaccharide/colanic/teichoic acid biosynthesis glycosyltransferase